MQDFQQNYCRICLDTKNLTKIFFNDSKVTTTIAEKIMYCASVQVSFDDSLPTNICKQCLFYLNTAYVFKTVCEWTDFKLRKAVVHNKSRENLSDIEIESLLGAADICAALIQCRNFSNIQKLFILCKKRYNFSLVKFDINKVHSDSIAQNSHESNSSEKINMQPKSIHNGFITYEKLQETEINCELNKSTNTSNMLFTNIERITSLNKPGIIMESNVDNLQKPRINEIQPIQTKSNVINKILNVQTVLNCKDFWCKNKSSGGNTIVSIDNINVINNTLEEIKTELFTKESLRCKYDNLSDQVSRSQRDHEEIDLDQNDSDLVFHNGTCKQTSNETNYFAEEVLISAEEVLISAEDEAVKHDVVDKKHNVILENINGLSMASKVSKENYLENSNLEMKKSKVLKKCNLHNENFYFETFSPTTTLQKKVIVENNIVINELSSAMSSKEAYQYKNGRNNFYDDHLTFVNNKDSLLINQNNEVDKSVEKVGKDFDIEINGLKNNLNSLSNISLHDFENFEREQLFCDNSQYVSLTFNDTVNNSSLHTSADKKMKPVTTTLQTKFENRVGRHIAKKNASQPPKRYGPALQTTFKVVTETHIENIKQNIDEDFLLVEKQTEEIIGTKENLQRTNDIQVNILDQDYILEGDLSMPEPMFEETVITDGLYLDNDTPFLVTSSDATAVNSVSSVICTNNSENIEFTKIIGKKGIRCRRDFLNQQRKKSNTYREQTTSKQESVKPRIKCIKRIKNNTKINYHNRCNNRIHKKKAKKNYQMPKQPALNNSDISNDDGYNFKSQLKRNNSNKCNSNDFHSNEDLDYESYSDDYNYKNSKRINKKRKSCKNTKQNNMNTTCKICSKSFPFPSHLQRHLTAHIGVKQFTCKYCSKQFLHSYNLSVHVRSHTGDFPLKCNICNRGFTSPSVLERHERSHTGETPYQCQHCQQQFSHASSLSMHEKMHLNRPSFTCDICFKVFSYKSSLTAHKKGHTGVKPFKCSVCHKRFTRRTSLMRHTSCHSS